MPVTKFACLVSGQTRKIAMSGKEKVPEILGILRNIDIPAKQCRSSGNSVVGCFAALLRRACVVAENLQPWRVMMMRTGRSNVGYDAADLNLKFASHPWIGGGERKGETHCLGRQGTWMCGWEECRSSSFLVGFKLEKFAVSS